MKHLSLVHGGWAYSTLIHHIGNQIKHTVFYHVLRTWTTSQNYSYAKLLNDLLPLFAQPPPTRWINVAFHLINLVGEYFSIVFLVIPSSYNANTLANIIYWLHSFKNTNGAPNIKTSYNNWIFKDHRIPGLEKRLDGFYPLLQLPIHRASPHCPLKTWREIRTTVSE